MIVLVKFHIPEDKPVSDLLDHLKRSPTKYSYYAVGIEKNAEVDMQTSIQKYIKQHGSTVG